MYSSQYYARPPTTLHVTYLVAFDDKPLARGALRKAVEYAEPTNHDVVAVTVIPEGDIGYYLDKRWIGTTRETKRSSVMSGATAQAIRTTLAGRVATIAPDARFDPIVADLPAVSTQGIAMELRAAIAEHHASDVFVGARDPERLVSALIGPRDTKYHLHMIRRPYIPDSDLAQYS